MRTMIIWSRIWGTRGRGWKFCWK